MDKLISLQDAIKAIDEKAKRIKNEDTLNGLAGAVGILFDLLPVRPQEPKTGHWILTQRDKYIDICCSECGNARFKEYAYGYTIDELNLEEIKDLIKKNQMDYCECCGTKMVEE